MHPCVCFRHETNSAVDRCWLSRRGNTLRQPSLASAWALRTAVESTPLYHKLKGPPPLTARTVAEDGFLMAKMGVQPAVGVTPGAFLPDMRRAARK